MREREKEKKNTKKKLKEKYIITCKKIYRPDLLRKIVDTKC